MIPMYLFSVAFFQDDDNLDIFCDFIRKQSNLTHLDLSPHRFDPDTFFKILEAYS